MKSKKTTQITQTEAAGAFAALGSEQRLCILQTLVRAGPDGLSMGELGDRSAVSGSTLTHHLRLLMAAGLVTQQKQGRSIICTAVSFDMVETLSGYLLQHCCAESSQGEHRGKSHA